MDKIRSLKKSYPRSYPEEVTKLVDALSMEGAVFLTGSSSQRNQLYGSDYDAHNIIRLTEPTKEIALRIFAKRFQDVVKRMSEMKSTFISDIKAGVREDWRILRKNARLIQGKITNYYPKESREKIESLKESGVISEKEAASAHALIKDHPSIPEFLAAKSKLKYHTIRWSVKNVLQNRNVLRDGSVMKLEEAFDQNITTKIDVIVFMQKSRFVEVSMNYEFYNNGHHLNPDDINWEGSYQEGIKGFIISGNYFKVLKRCYSMAREAKDYDELERIRDVLNGDLGRLYNIQSDISLLIEMSENKINVPLEQVQYELDQFIMRLSQVYGVREYISREKQVTDAIREARELPFGKMSEKLRYIKKQLTTIIQKEAKKILRRDFGDCLKSITSTKKRAKRKNPRGKKTRRS